MISPSKTRSESVVLTSKLGVEYHMSYVGPVVLHPRGGLVRHNGCTYANVVNAFPKSTETKWGDDLSDWYNVDTHSRYARYLDTEPL